MPKIRFIPLQQTVEVNENAKILASALRAKIPIRFGCSACRCGTCGVQVSGTAELSKMADNEKKLLASMHLNTDGTVRLACQTRVISGEVVVDLDFQDKYSPDTGLSK